MNKLQVGVIGTGVMGQRHCRVYSSMANVELVGVYDQAVERATQVARQHHTRFFSLLDDLLAQVDAVSIATPTPTHADLVCAALERGVHVLVEKPIADTLEAAERIVAAQRRTGSIVQVGHVERFNPTFAELHNVLADMHPIAITMRRLSPYMVSATDVDVICDLMIHDIDLALELGGSWPEHVQAVGRTVHEHGADHAVATLSFAHGPMVTMLASRVTEQKVRDIAVVADEAYVEADLLRKSIAVHHRTIPEYLQNQTTVKYRQESLIEHIVVPASEPLLMELQHFVTCVRENRRPTVSAFEGTQALRLAWQIRSMIASQLDIAAPLELHEDRQHHLMEVV